MAQCVSYNITINYLASPNFQSFVLYKLYFFECVSWCPLCLICLIECLSLSSCRCYAILWRNTIQSLTGYVPFVPCKTSACLTIPRCTVTRLVNLSVWTELHSLTIPSTVYLFSCRMQLASRPIREFECSLIITQTIKLHKNNCQWSLGAIFESLF